MSQFVRQYCIFWLGWHPVVGVLGEQREPVIPPFLVEDFRLAV